jgi:hypothetical protein
VLIYIGDGFSTPILRAPCEANHIIKLRTCLTQPRAYGMFYIPTNERGNMARAISVKVARTKVIDALTQKLQEMKLAKEAYEQADAQWEIDVKQYREKVSQIGLAHFDKVKGEDKDISIRNWGYGSDKKTKVEITIELDNSLLPTEPERPTNPFQSNGYGRNYIGGYDDRVAEIINAINILKMSDEEVVSTSTYQHVARYL